MLWGCLLGGEKGLGLIAHMDGTNGVLCFGDGFGFVMSSRIRTSRQMIDICLEFECGHFTTLLLLL